MKKIGILYGKEDTFPQAFIDRVNAKGLKDIKAESVSIDMVQQAAPTEYAVIIDRISQDVPFYRAYLKNAALSGTCVINNPFWWSADEKFFNNALAEKVGVPVPKTVILPSHERPDDTGEKSFRNLKFPYGWEENFEYVGWPAYMKPHDGGGWKNVYKVNNPQDLWDKHAETGQLVMLLQEEIQFTEYFRCYVLGGHKVHIMQYEPRNPHHLRYVKDAPPVDQKILKQVEEGCIKLNQALGYDFNTVEFAVRDGVAYAIDFCNPAPDADVHSVGEENFEWIVENAALLAIEKAEQHQEGKMNLTWGTFIKDQIAVSPKSSSKRKAVRKAPVKKAATSRASIMKSVSSKAGDTTKEIAKATAKSKPATRSKTNNTKAKAAGRKPKTTRSKKTDEK
ncbi:ATP-grasp domain-containing protein [Portibacter marinus]|uniref:ATP-grasp domain-containing protein n=1 Tax=Portibacter marinus TaxID=2898660 RepID=UPI001F31C4DC|nr:hypothetical protein [Portibacter marinus]